MALPHVFKGRCHGGPMDGRLYSADQPHQVFTVPSPSAPIINLDDPIPETVELSSGAYEWDYPGKCWRWRA